MVDFNVGDAYGRFGQLRIAEMGEENGEKTEYWLRCSECAKDDTVGDILHKSTRKSLRASKEPCFCNKGKAYTEEQQVRNIIKACKAKELIFHGFAHPYHGVETLARLECVIDGNTWETTVHQLLRSGRGCEVCNVKKRRNLLMKPDKHYIDKFMSQGVFLEGTVFTRHTDNVQRWSYFCPRCSVDEYVQAGVCDGVFTADTVCFLKGQRACRCSPYHFSSEQRIYQMKKKIERCSLPYEFVCWENEYDTMKKTKAIMDCKHHGIFKIDTSNFFNYNTGCPICNKAGFDPAKKALVYVLKAEGTHNNFTGFGITGNLKNRFKSHRRNLGRAGLVISEYQTFSAWGEDAQKLERLVKSAFPWSPQEIDGFRREATHPHLYDNVIEFIKSSDLLDKLSA